MFNYYNFMSILETLIVALPVLLTVAFVTVAERKTMASMQRRVGPNVVGYYGSLQAFADALKLLLKEYVSPTQSNPILFFLGPIITLVFSLLGYAVITYGSGLSILDTNLGIIYMLAVSSLSTYGILLAGWSANSKYAFLGSLRSTAQLISYELILSSAVLCVVLLSGSLSLTVTVEMQKDIWLILPLFPVFLVFFIGSIAETNRAPFDLAEAESELVSGFMTEHSAVIFVFFFLAEYASIVLISIFMTILFLGGYNISNPLPIDTLEEIIYPLYSQSLTSFHFYFLKWIYAPLNLLECLGFSLPTMIHSYSSLLEYEISNFYFAFSNLQESVEYTVPANESFLLGSIISSSLLGIKTSILVFGFIWVRASFPRIRYDQLMSVCWTILLPVVIAFILIIPCVCYCFNLFVCGVSLL